MGSEVRLWLRGALALGHSYGNKPFVASLIARLRRSFRGLSLVAASICLASQYAHADGVVPPVTGTAKRWVVSPNPSEPNFATAQEACDAETARYNSLAEASDPAGCKVSYTTNSCQPWYNGIFNMLTGGTFQEVDGWAVPPRFYCTPYDNHTSSDRNLVYFDVSVPVCPANSIKKESGDCVCNSGYAPTGLGGNQSCAPWWEVDRTKKPLACWKSLPKGNPIYPLAGTKRESLDLGVSIGGLPLLLTYDSARQSPLTTGSEPYAIGTDRVATELNSFGPLWLSSLHRRLVFGPDNRSALSSRGDGSVVSFSGDGLGGFTPDADTNDRLQSVSGGYRYVDAASRSVESYDSSGLLQNIFRADGGTLTFTYSDASTPSTIAPGAGYLLQVQDNFGRTVRFEYAAAQGYVSKIIDPAGQALMPSYDANGNLTQITWQDTTHRRYVYESAGLPWAMTGIVDENDTRYATFGYDALGRAISTEHAGGVNRYSVTYAAPPGVKVTDVYESGVVRRTRSWQIPASVVVAEPNGATSTIGTTTLLGMPAVTSQDQPAGSGCAGSTSNTSYDANGNLARRDDFNGNRACYANDLSRNVETARVEGLANTADCASVTPAGATLPAGSRKISSQWPPDWRLPSAVAQPKKLVTYVYNGQPDPFNGNAIATCTPSQATLPDGKPIVVLCKQVEQATTDADGSQGFSATLQAGVANRSWSYTYNQYGQVLTATDPRGNTTTYTYYADTTIDHTVGDLQSVSNAAGHATQYTRYDQNGRNLQNIDPNGTITDTQYSARGWVTQVSVTPAGGGLPQITAYGYDAAGQLTSMQLSDGSTLSYSYDAAHRLTGVTDAAGNSVAYTLDNAGNRVKEEVKDSSGALARSISRAFDALNRVQSTTGTAQ